MINKNDKYKIKVEKDGKYFHSFIPALIGCHSQGKTTKDAVNNLAEALSGYFIVKNSVFN